MHNSNLCQRLKLIISKTKRELYVALMSSADTEHHQPVAVPCRARKGLTSNGFRNLTHFFMGRECFSLASVCSLVRGLTSSAGPRARREALLGPLEPSPSSHTRPVLAPLLAGPPRPVLLVAVAVAASPITPPL